MDTNLLELLARRTPLAGLARKLVAGPDRDTVLSLDEDNAAPAAITTDGGRMTCHVVISTQSQDHSKDIVVTAGMDLSTHRRNPVVLLDHGADLTLPLGLAEDPDRRHTVKLLGDRAEAVTWFSQKLRQAEEVFALIDEGILRGASIGFLPHDYDVLDEVGPSGRNGLLLKKTELVEYSHTALPDNREALTIRLEKGRLAGGPISPLIRKALRPHCLPRTPTVTGGYDAHKGGRSMAVSTKNGKAGGRLPTRTKSDYPPPDDDRDDDTDDTGIPGQEDKVAEGSVPDIPEEMPTPGGDEPDIVDDTPDMPQGAKTLTDLHTEISNLVGKLEEHAKVNERPEVSAKLDDLHEMCDTLLSEIAGDFSTLYPDLPKLEGGLAEGGDTADESDDVPDFDAEDAPKKKKKAAKRRNAKRLETLFVRRDHIKVKRLTKAARSVCGDAAEDMGELAKAANLSGAQKRLCKLHANELTKLCKMGDDEDDDAAEYQKTISAQARMLEKIEKSYKKLETAYRAALGGH